MVPLPNQMSIPAIRKFLLRKLLLGQPLNEQGGLRRHELACARHTLAPAAVCASRNAPP